VKIRITLDSTTSVEVSLKKSFMGMNLSKDEEQVLRILIENILKSEIETDLDDGNSEDNNRE
jgi:hypothetical protein